MNSNIFCLLVYSISLCYVSCKSNTQKEINNSNFTATKEYSVKCPEVHELINVAMALTNAGKSDSNMINMTTSYYQEVLEHFDQYRYHPLIQEINRHLGDKLDNSSYVFYLNMRTNATKYHIVNGRLVNSYNQYQMGFGSTDQVDGLRSLIQSFYVETDFETFYQNHNHFYSSLIDDYLRLVPLNKMWDWLEYRFPQRYSKYYIFFSPLNRRCTRNTIFQSESR